MTAYSPKKIIFGQDHKHNLNEKINKFQQNSTTTMDYIKYMNNVRSIINNTSI